MYLPFENVAPISPYRCLRNRSSAVRTRAICLASIRFINNFYLGFNTRMLTNRKAWRNATNIKNHSILPTIPHIANYNDFVSPFHRQQVLLVANYPPGIVYDTWSNTTCVIHPVPVRIITFGINGKITYLPYTITFHRLPLLWAKCSIHHRRKL